MGSDRCPSCAASVRPGSDWCTLCYADLRPAPPPVERAPYPRPSSPPTYPAAAAAPPTDALHAPYEHVLAAVYGGGAPSAPAVVQPAAVSPEAPARPIGWPCMLCGEPNSFDRAACSACGAAFGAGLRSAVPVVDRKKMMLYAIGAAFTFLALVAILTFAMTKRPGNEPQVVPKRGVTSEEFVAPETQSSGPSQDTTAGPPPGLDFVPGQNLLPSESPAP